MNDFSAGFNERERVKKCDDLPQGEKDRIASVAEKFEDIRKTIKKKVNDVYCKDCGCRFDLNDEDKEKIRVRTKFVILCPECNSDNIAVQANRTI